MNTWDITANNRLLELALYRPDFCKKCIITCTKKVIDGLKRERDYEWSWGMHMRGLKAPETKFDAPKQKLPLWILHQIQEIVPVPCCTHFAYSNKKTCMLLFEYILPHRASLEFPSMLLTLDWSNLSTRNATGQTTT